MSTHGGRASLELFHSCPPILQPHSFLPPRISTFLLEFDLIITKSCSSSASLFCINNNYLYPEETTPYTLLNSEETTLSALLDAEETTLPSLTLFTLWCSYFWNNVGNMKCFAYPQSYFQLTTLLLPKKCVSFGVWTAMYTPFSLFLPPVASNFL